MEGWWIIVPEWMHSQATAEAERIERDRLAGGINWSRDGRYKPMREGATIMGTVGELTFAEMVRRMGMAAARVSADGKTGSDDGDVVLLGFGRPVAVDVKTQGRFDGSVNINVNQAKKEVETYAFAVLEERQGAPYGVCGILGTCSRAALLEAIGRAGDPIWREVPEGKPPGSYDYWSLRADFLTEPKKASPGLATRYNPIML